jgi:hypothetical protein
VWITRLIEAAGLPPIPTVADELDAVTAGITIGPNHEWTPSKVEDRAVPIRLARVRYRFLAAHYEEAGDVVSETGRPNDPALGALWDRARRAQARVVELERQLVKAKSQAGQTWADFAEAVMLAEQGPMIPPPPAKRGRKGNPQHREPVRALIRIYGDLFGVEPRRSHDGPVMRFVTAFFNNLDGDWFWLDADRFEASQRHERTRKHNERLKPVRRPAALADIVRHALTAERNGEQSEWWEDGPSLMPGYFLRHRRGEAEMPLEPPKKPEICRLQPRPDSR